ncbi:MAG: hypothetical protein L6406_08390 [Desulfobacterales bacterium]|nr:hypothetical protein [Desulfobacterales bacterium]
MKESKSVAIIGSFKQFYETILSNVQIFRNNNIYVNSPLGSKIICPNIPFVRFESDPSCHSDEMIQTITLERIFNSDVVYVVNPGGYIGKTTCYEIGRVIQRRQPIYFSDAPDDIPIKIPSSHIVNSDMLSKKINESKICQIFSANSSEYCDAEIKLLEI